MTEIPDPPTVSRFHTATPTNTASVSPMIGGASELGGVRIRPVKYRYVMANIRTGAMIVVLPMTSVTYTVGMYSGTDMSGTVYLPDLLLQQMPHDPLDRFEQWKHFEWGTPLGSMFEVGNVAIYVMRNEEVVWGGILWSRTYSSGEKTMTISAVSWDAYIYYRVIRKTVAFPDTVNKTDRYTIWRALLAQVLHPSGSDFYWPGDTGQNNSGARLAEAGQPYPWTGLYGGRAPTLYLEYWPNNAPAIELPPATLSSGLQLTTIDESWQGFQMDNVGSQLEQFANINNLITGNGFEYRVLCWWNETEQKFHQRYTFGEMIYQGVADDYTRTPIGIRSAFLGNGYANAEKTVFDFPGHISDWSLSESMEDAATRVIVTGGSEDAKIAGYASATKLLRPGGVGNGSDGWLLYDKVFNYETQYYDNSGMEGVEPRARVLLSHYHPPVAAQISDIGQANTSQRASQRSTVLSVTLYKDPTTEFPPWKIGDWVTFAINDSLYGGTMYLKRRIIRYTVTVLPDHESDYSHEQISLELTDQTKVEAGG